QYCLSGSGNGWAGAECLHNCSERIDDLIERIVNLIERMDNLIKRIVNLIERMDGLIERICDGREATGRRDSSVLLNNANQQLK
ncbi:MAG: hypothetical protein LBI89_04085, partial [Prevotellaceae bacterium]|nr:hypothetical protein [Prevotellaceae bacterium]